MALAVTINFTITDAKGKSAITKVRVPTGFSINQYSLFAVAMAQLVTNLSEGSITEITVGMPLSLSGATIRGAAVNIANVFKKAIFVAKSAITGLGTKFFFPTYNESNTVTGSDDVDAADADVAALVAIIEGGVNTGGEIVQPIDMRGNDLVDVTEMREIFRAA